MFTPRIIINNLSFHIENTPVAFRDIHLSFESLKYGIVGDNGVGKTTFLKLLTGDLLPENGSIQHQGTLLYLPQSHGGISENATIADVLGVSNILNAMQHIQFGNYADNDFEIINNQWDIEARIQSALSHFKISTIDINTPFHTLSGGQKTKILLSKTLVFESDFILMDEPTNNLDKTSRDILYDYIRDSKKGFIIISHDRKLLNNMDCIVEITTKGINLYGGNYDLYREQKDIELSALEKDFDEAKQKIQRVKHSIQSTKEKHARSAGRGRRAFLEGHIDKMTARSKAGKAEKSKKRRAVQEEKMITDNTNKIADIREKIEIKTYITASLDATHVPNSKTVLEIKSVYFKYTAQNNFIIKDFNLEIIGAERVALTGENGCGKSTLIKLIRRELFPISGSIKIGINKIAYLDQSILFLDKNKSLVENFMNQNLQAKLFDAYSALAEFQFRNKDAEKIVADLSGGEKIRAGLAISLMSAEPPQLIILDEPTNHLDLRSIEAIESILKSYQGAMLVVSHDEAFLKNIGITRTVRM